MSFILEGILDIDALPIRTEVAFLHQLPVWDNVEIPLPEFIDLALLLADDHSQQRFPHPGQLALAENQVLIVGRRGQLSFERDDPFRPFGLDQVVHAHRGDLVDRDEHDLPALPLRRVVLDEVGGDAIEAA